MNNSKIEWTDHTFNPWWGCMKVSEGCKNCYAEALDRRWKGGHWGPGSTRKPMSEAYWTQPLKWNKAAAAAGVQAKVFCASMADVFEETDMVGDPENHDVITQARIRLFGLIFDTPNLIWQLLTKRPHNMINVLKEIAIHLPHPMLLKWLEGHPPANVWIGTSVEDQAAADTRIPYLLKVPAVIRFLSCEPLLGPISFRWAPWHDYSIMISKTIVNGKEYQCHSEYDGMKGIHWVIAGGESGHGARPMHPDWVRGLRDQCKASEVSFFFKQQGEWLPFYDRTKDDPDWRNVPKESPSVTYINLAGGFGFHGDRIVYFKKVGKKAAGRLLDGVEHNEFPKEAM